MADTFNELGLSTELVQSAGAAGFVVPTALQRAAIPVLRRGGNAVLHASTGAGVVGAYGLALLDRLAGQGATKTPEGPLSLVLTATDDEAASVARALGQLARTTGLRVQSFARGWPKRTSAAHIGVMSAPAALEALRTSSLKLETLQVLVIDGLAAILVMFGRDSLAPLAASLPRDAQRVIITGDLNKDVSDFVEGHVRRALSIPSRPADARQAGLPEPPIGTVAYAVVPESEKIDVVGEMLSGAKETPVIVCRTDERASELAEALPIRGFHVGAADDEEREDPIAASSADASALSAAWVLSYDVPFDAEALVSRHRTGGAVLVTPRELPHLRRIAAEGNMSLRPLAGADPIRSDSDLAVFRDRVRAAARQEDLSAQVLVLAPLLEEMSAVEIAAALSALLRKQVGASTAPTVAPPQAGTPKPYVRLYIGLGEKDNIRPGDIVGAIAGEAGLPGDQIGRIEIRDSFSVVEVPGDMAERIIHALNGTTVKGRSVRVDYDRQTKSPLKPGPGRPSGDRPPGGRGPAGPARPDRARRPR
jgi:ATP-dependent RNA helicase DeaD